MKSIVAYLTMVAALVCSGQSFSPARLKDDVCRPFNEGGSKCCYPIICDSTDVVANLGYNATAYVNVDTGDGQPCHPSGKTHQPTCTANDRKFSYYIDWASDTPGSYMCSRNNPYTLGDFKDTFQYPNVQRTYKVRILYCNRSPDESEQCCADPFYKEIVTKS